MKRFLMLSEKVKIEKQNKTRKKQTTKQTNKQTKKKTKQNNDQTLLFATGFKINNIYVKLRFTQYKKKTVLRKDTSR